MISLISNIEAHGGEYPGEPILEGLFEVKKLKWDFNTNKANLKIIILITDEIPNCKEFGHEDKCSCNISFENDIANFIK